MRAITIGKNEAGQRLDRLLAKYLDQAPKGFLYKMLRKKNIMLNGRKAAGDERLQEGDRIELYLAEETIAGFQKTSRTAEPGWAGEKPEVIYEDENVLLLNKPAGLLSQKARDTDVSLVEYVISYLLEKGELGREQLALFRPGICNRLDRNTSGLVAAGKTLSGLQELNGLFRKRELHKYYRCIVAGSLRKPQRIEGFLQKDAGTNRVKVLRELLQSADPDRREEPFQYICTEYVPLGQLAIGGRTFTYLEVNLITGRSHQIRAHLACAGHPLIGDAKYGDARINSYFRKHYGLNHQLLHAYRLKLPRIEEGVLAALSEKEFIAPLPELFVRILDSQRESAG